MVEEEQADGNHKTELDKPDQQVSKASCGINEEAREKQSALLCFALPFMQSKYMLITLRDMNLVDLLYWYRISMQNEYWAEENEHTHCNHSCRVSNSHQELNDLLHYTGKKKMNKAD